MKSFCLRAHFRGRSQTAKLGPNSLLARRGNCCASTRKIFSLPARSVHLRQQHVLMQPRRLSRAAGKLCHKHAWNTRSKQRHVPDSRKTSTAMEGQVLKQKRNDVQSRVGATATRAHAESPLRTELLVDSCSVRHHDNCCASKREIPTTWISIRTQSTERCSCDNTAAFARREHTLISLRWQKDMFRRKDCCVLTPPAHLDLSPCARRPVHATTLLPSHAVSTLGSPSARKETCSGETTAAFSRREHTWISLRAQRDMFHRKDCCLLTPRAHLDLSPCARRPVHATTLLPSHATSTLGSLSVRKETCSGKTAVALSRREHTWISLCAQRDMFHRKDCCDLRLPPKIDDFYLRTPDPVSSFYSQMHTRPLRYRDP